jgi:hypothetical protein
MKRDMDLARLILFEIEKQPYTGKWVEINIDKYDPEEITYHILLLVEAGLIEADNLSDLSGVDWKPKRLTWEGHEFLDAARDDTRWNQAKVTMGKIGGFVFEIGKQVLIDLIKSDLRQNHLL